MTAPARLPAGLGTPFAAHEARRTGVAPSRLRAHDLERPFRGVRSIPSAGEGEGRDAYVRLVAAYRRRMTEREFFSHETAAALWGAPVPLRKRDGIIHSAIRDDSGIPRASGVRGHRVGAEMVDIVTLNGASIASPASTWAMLGAWSVTELVVLGDFLCRVWRSGHGRPHQGRAPLTTIDALRSQLFRGRRIGKPRLREAIELIRTDSWSPRETECRVLLVRGGLPEPVLNVDVRDDAGRFIACVDMAYPAMKIAVEYQGRLHSEQYADDIERIERLRSAGWIVIQITAALFTSPRLLLQRVRAAIRARI